MLEAVDNMDRYSRLLSLKDFSKEKLDLLKSKKILIIGVGGVGQHVATYLITNGIIDMTIVDFDKVEMSNLNRQILLTEDDIDKAKIDVVKAALIKKNSEAKIKTINLKIDENNIKDIKLDFDVIIDAVDNWPTRLVIAKHFKNKNIPILHIGVDGYKGQYCLFKNKSLLDIVNDDIVTSPRDGVMGPMVGTISSLASTYLIKYLVNDIDDVDVLYYFDFESSHFGKVKI